jgi:hypothetical protein
VRRGASSVTSIVVSPAYSSRRGSICNRSSWCVGRTPLGNRSFGVAPSGSSRSIATAEADVEALGDGIEEAEAAGTVGPDGAFDAQAIAAEAKSESATTPGERASVRGRRTRWALDASG